MRLKSAPSGIETRAEHELGVWVVERNFLLLQGR